MKNLYLISGKAESDPPELFTLNLYGKVGLGKQTLVDCEDYEKYCNYKLGMSTAGGYATIRIGGVTEKLHRLILEAKKGEVVDHINHNKLDNRKCNLRICTRAQNNYNRQKYPSKSHSQYKGVTLNNGGNFAANISINNKTFNIGVYLTEVEAAIAYNKVASSTFGEFALLNNIPNWEQADVDITKNTRRKKLKSLSKFPGVYYDSARNKWAASVYVGNRKSKSLGRFESELEAYDAYKAFKEMA